MADGMNADVMVSMEPPLKVRLVLCPSQRSWIIEKFMSRLCENLPRWNVEATVAEEPAADCDVNHWCIYCQPWSYWHRAPMQKPTPSTALITHIDDAVKAQVLKDCINQAYDVGICLSRMTVEELVGRGIDREKLCYVTPGHDNVAQPRRIVIGITSKVYSDGRKREHLLVNLAHAMDLALFHFDLIGAGWEQVIPHLEAAGATVAYFPGTADYVADYDLLLERLRGFDYYLYPGLDEGSMGILDALAAGVKTIVTTQGFHLDIPGGITHGFWDERELIAIFHAIAEERKRLLQSVAELSWSNYAKKHAVIWRALLAGRQHDIAALLGQVHEAPLPNQRPWLKRALAEVQFLAQARRSYLWDTYVDRRKWRVRHALSKIKRRLLRRPARSPMA